MKNKILSVIAVLVVVIVVVLATQATRQDIALGSVVRGGEYFATTTTGMADGMSQITTNIPTTLGSIIVASSSATSFTVWDAASTTDAASTSMATLKAAVGEGTYVFDLGLKRGLILELPTNFNGSYVTTFRP